MQIYKTMHFNSRIHPVLNDFLVFFCQTQGNIIKGCVDIFVKDLRNYLTTIVPSYNSIWQYSPNCISYLYIFLRITIFNYYLYSSQNPYLWNRLKYLAPAVRSSLYSSLVMSIVFTLITFV